MMGESLEAVAASLAMEGVEWGEVRKRLRDQGAGDVDYTRALIAWRSGISSALLEACIASWEKILNG